MTGSSREMICEVRRRIAINTMPRAVGPQRAAEQRREAFNASATLHEGDPSSRISIPGNIGNTPDFGVHRRGK